MIILNLVKLNVIRFWLPFSDWFKEPNGIPSGSKSQAKLSSRPRLEKNSDQMYSCPRDWRLSASYGHHWGHFLKPPTLSYWGRGGSLRGREGLNWALCIASCREKLQYLCKCMQLGIFHFFLRADYGRDERSWVEYLLKLKYNFTISLWYIVMQ